SWCPAASSRRVWPRSFLECCHRLKNRLGTRLGAISVRRFHAEISLVNHNQTGESAIAYKGWESRGGRRVMAPPARSWAPARVRGGLDLCAAELGDPNQTLLHPDRHDRRKRCLTPGCVGDQGASALYSSLGSQCPCIDLVRQIHQRGAGDGAGFSDLLNMDASVACDHGVPCGADLGPVVLG